MENEKLIKKDWRTLVPFILFYFIITFLARNNSFFWDTIQLGSMQAHWFYDHNFRHYFLPEKIDSGHPPVFGLYLAIMWKLFGRTLTVSHFSMLPFLFGIVIQLYILSKKFFNSKFTVLVLLVLLIDPTLLAQSILVSPDIVLFFFFFFLLCLNAILNKSNFILSVGLIVLGIISLRGMMCVAALYFVHQAFILVDQKRFDLRSFVLSSLVYVPSVSIACAWLYLHYRHTGWIGYHENSPWAESFVKASGFEIIKNIFILGWRLIDFGRIGIWLLAIPVIVITIKRKLMDGKTIKLFILFFFLILIITPNLILHTGLLAHRYLLLIYFSFGLIILYQLQKIWSNHFTYISIVLIVILVSGNFWVYPDRISKGWDSSLAHYPYYNYRNEMIQFMDQEELDKSKIGSSFPNVSDSYYTDLSSIHWKFKDKDLGKDQYIFYSNVFNGFSDEELEELSLGRELKNSILQQLKLFYIRKSS